MIRLHGKWLFIGGLIVGTMIGWFISFPPNDSSSAASWVQAIGTIAAIFASVQIVKWQFDRQQEASLRADHVRLRQRVELVRKVADEACSLVQFLEANTANDELAKAYFAWTFDLRSVRIVQSSLEAIPVSDLPSPDLVMPFIILKTAVARATEGANQIGMLIAGDKERIGHYTSSDARDAIVVEAGNAAFAMQKIDEYASQFK